MKINDLSIQDTEFRFILDRNDVISQYSEDKTFTGKIRSGIQASAFYESVQGIVITQYLVEKKQKN